MNWFLFFLIAFVLSSLLSFVLIIWAKGKSKFFFRLGGTAIINSFLISVLIISEIAITSQITAVILGSIAILVFGILDDRKNFNWKIQFLFQLFLALILIWSGFKIDLISFSGNELLRLDYWHLDLLEKSFSIISGFFIIFWSIGIINAVNWLDGSDGLLSVAGVLSLLAVFFISLKPEVNQPALAVISVIGIGAFFGFFIFNFPSAKIEAGTSGSYFAGFLLASLAIIAGTKIATTMVVLILPVVDFVWVIIERIKEGQSIFEKDDKKRHLHYKLLNLGFSPRQVLLSYGIFLSLALTISFFVVNQTQKIILLITEFMMISLFIVSLSKSINLKKINVKIKKLLLKLIWLVIFTVIILMLGSFYQKQKDRSDFQTDAKIKIAEEINMEVKIVQTPKETYQGLSGLQSLPRKSGMLFIYNRMSPSAHVMREMRFDLDFVFIRDNEVVFIQEKISKNFKGIIQSPINCNQVLEINAGEVKKWGIKVGDKIKFIKK